MANPASLPAWSILTRQAQQLADVHLDTLFADNPQRAEQLQVSAPGLYLDYSKQRLTAPVMQALTELADQQNLAQQRHALLTGEKINVSEQRAAWHTALRAPKNRLADGLTTPEVHRVLDEVADFVHAIETGEWRGHSGEKVTHFVNIGIGGSDLGPRLVYQALSGHLGERKAYFVANVDPAELDDILATLKPDNTLFIITSKSFKTAETLVNARAAKQWLVDAGLSEQALAKHMVAISTNAEAVAEFGIRQMFEFWDWVGGRYSLWSAVGLAVALTQGMAVFRELLAGAHAMDQHFAEAPLAENLPVVLALIGIWNRNFLNLPGHIVVPYAQRLVYFSEWLQQLEMESNGKGVTHNGGQVAVDTAPMVWGTVGTNAQHAYFQMLHQASLAADIDFILPLPKNLDNNERMRHCVANCLAQSEALMRGRTATAISGSADEQDIDPVRHFDGNRPSSTLLVDKLDAWHLGSLLAAYEHKVFVQGVIWGINSFDQWGVELGKTLAQDLLSGLENPTPHVDNASTYQLLQRVRRATRKPS